MFEQFSGSYYLGRLYVEPAEGATPAMCKLQYERLRREFYGERETTPMVMKLGSRHFPVTGQESVPADTLAMPTAVLADTPVDNPPTLQEVLLATADRADQLLSLTGQGDPAGI